ncbi:MAG: response regulator [bacterium]
MSINSCPDQMDLKTRTVLYVEDDAETREQFIELLTRPVGTLITAADGAEGLAAFIKHAPDIVITDILMPRMDGLTMARKIRNLAPTVPIIVMTAFEQTDYMLRAITIGIDRYVAKPVNSDLLFESLLACVHRLRAEQQLKLQHQLEIREEWSKHNETVAILSAGIAHDYNNQLQAIIGYVTLARAKLDPASESSQFLRLVEQCFGEAGKLGQMLRILGDDYSESMEHVPVIPCIRGAIENALAGTAVVLSLDCPVDLPRCRLVKHHMQLVFAGLTRNAVEAMQGAGTLHLVAQAATVTGQDPIALEPGAYIHLAVTDSGTGIPAEVLPKVFDPYFSTKQRSSPRGIGLSLALCRTIIMKHGGAIRAESGPGNGTTLHVWLPVAE